jgi:hypothetical protein
MKHSMLSIILLAASVVLAGCAAPVTSDSYCVARNPAGRCTEWKIGPSRQQATTYDASKRARDYGDHGEARSAPGPMGVLPAGAK